MTEKQSFTDILSDHCGGAIPLAEEYWERINDAVKEHGGSAQVSIVVKIKKTGDGQIELQPIVDYKAPRQTLRIQHRYIGKDNTVHLDDPNKKETGHVTIFKSKTKEA